MTHLFLPPRPGIRRTSVDDLAAPIPAAPFASNPEITVLASAWNQMRKHAESDLRRETGGLMLGQVFSQGAGQFHVVIREAMAAPETVASLASVEFTAETWRKLLEEKASRAAEATIVGWYHTHPGFGLFLSSLDLYIQRHFFRRPWHLALVVDPVGRSAAFFHLTQESLIRRDEFSLRVCGDGLWPAQSPDREPLRGTLETARLRVVLPLEQPPSVIAVGRKWLCAATQAGQIVFQALQRPDGWRMLLRDGEDVQAMAFDQRDRLHMLNLAHREVWQIDPTASTSPPRRLRVLGCGDWWAAIPHGLAVMGRRFLLQDGARLLVCELGEAEDCLRLKAEFTIPGLAGATLGCGNHGMAASGSHALVNNPVHDRIDVVTFLKRIKHISLAGSRTGLRQPLAIAAASGRLYALDSEAARIVELSLEGELIRQYRVEPDGREREPFLLAASPSTLYLGAHDGVYAMELQEP